MRGFETLTPIGRLRRIRSLAGSLLEKYGLAGASLAFLNSSRQTNYKVTVNSPASSEGKGGTFLLRVHWPVVSKPRVIRSEFSWLRAILEDTAIIVPEPLADLAGNDVSTMTLDPESKPVLCSVTRWVEGRRYIRRYGPGPDALRHVGRLMAGLHLHGQNWKKPARFERPRWEWEWVLGPSSPFCPDAGEGILDRESRELFEETSKRIRAAMARLGTTSDVFGLIHGDLIQVNYIFHEGDVRAIDFGDCGFGHYLYDMGITLFGLWGRDEKNRQREAFLEGYRELMPFSSAQEQLLDTFIAARAVALARFVMGSTDQRDLALAPVYVPYVLEGLKRWIRV